MSKLVLLFAVPAVAGLVVWNLSLSSELDEMRQRLDESREPAEPSKDAEAAGRAPAAVEARSREVARTTQQVTEIVERLAQVEARLPSPPAAGAAPGAPGAPSAESVPALPADVVATFGSDAFKSAVAKVLDERTDARRKERAERDADARTRFLLRDLTVTDQQRADVKRLVLATAERNEQIRQDESIPDEQRKSEIQANHAQQIESIAALLDAQSAETVRQRAAAAAGGGNRLRPGGGGGKQNAGGKKR